MIIHRLTYLGLSLLAILATGCSDDIATQNTLSGDGEKTPLGVTALLDTDARMQMRAANMEFIEHDVLLAYLRHVTWDGTTDGSRTPVDVQNSPTLVTFTKGSAGMTTYTGDDITPIGTNTALGLTSTNTQQTNDLTASPLLYWDDFSANTDADGTLTSTNLRDDNHYLQSYYGYCYNGVAPMSGTELDTPEKKAAGTIGWMVQTDQTAIDKSAFQHSDLLWSAEQTPIDYKHAVAERKGLILPYTHAMSKVTINITVEQGFAADYKLNTVVSTLHNMYTTCTCKAPTYTLSNKGTAVGDGMTTDITMWQGPTATSKQCTYEAIVVPSVLSIGNNLATLTGVDGNTYTIPVTAEMLQAATAGNSWKGWGNELDETKENISNGVAQSKPLLKSTLTIEEGKGYEMRSGVNYVLDVNLNKQGITVSAQIKDWVNVEAWGRGEILFSPDKTEKGTIAEELKAHGFDVYKNSVNTAFTDKSTSLTWQSTEWDYDPAIYWAGQTDASYFRALSPAGTTTSIAQGNDILWGYGCDALTGTVSDAERAKIGTTDEVAITPRTGDVPLHFEHAMSKITINLVTAAGDYNSATSPAVNLAGATIEISHLATTGTIELVGGNITPGSITAASITPHTSVSNYAVIPQTITDDAILKITLADGTTYKKQLNKCIISDANDDNDQDDDQRIKEWQRGKHYTYTIHLDKEAIIFRAMIKEWDEKTGSGNATLEWD